MQFGKNCTEFLQVGGCCLEIYSSKFLPHLFHFTLIWTFDILLTESIRHYQTSTILITQVHPFNEWISDRTNIQTKNNKKTWNLDEEFFIRMFAWEKIKRKSERMHYYMVKKHKSLKVKLHLAFRFRLFYPSFFPPFLFYLTYV